MKKHLLALVLIAGCFLTRELSVSAEVSPKNITIQPSAKDAMTVDVQLIVQGVKKRDYTVQDLAAKAGATAVPALTELLADADARVRKLAVYCLRETNDASAARPLISATLDVDVQVAMTAAQALLLLASSALAPEVQRAFDRSTKPDVQRQLGLVLARIADPADLVGMKKSWKTVNGTAKEGLTVALAKHGDIDAQQEMIRQLEQAKATDSDETLRKSQWLEYAASVSQPWLLPVLGKLLRDHEPLVYVGIDVFPDQTQHLRTCDLALLIVAKITGAKFSFTLKPARNFTSAQLNEAAGVIKSRGP